MNIRKTQFNNGSFFFLVKLGWLIMIKPIDLWIQVLLDKYCKTDIGNMRIVATVQLGVED